MMLQITWRNICSDSLLKVLGSVKHFQLLPHYLFSTLQKEKKIGEHIKHVSIN